VLREPGAQHLLGIQGQIEAVLGYLAKTRRALRNRVIFLLSAKAGLRAKGKSGRTIPLSDEVRDALIEYRDLAILDCRWLSQGRTAVGWAHEPADDPALHRAQRGRAGSTRGPSITEDALHPHIRSATELGPFDPS
jgi:hypothetical protein